MPISHYWKAIIATLGAIVIAVEAALSDDVIVDSEWFKIAIAAVTAVGVYAKSNEPPA